MSAILSESIRWPSPFSKSASSFGSLAHIWPAWSCVPRTASFAAAYASSSSFASACCGGGGGWPLGCTSSAASSFLLSSAQRARAFARPEVALRASATKPAHSLASPLCAFACLSRRYCSAVQSVVKCAASSRCFLPTDSVFALKAYSPIRQVPRSSVPATERACFTSAWPYASSIFVRSCTNASASLHRRRPDDERATSAS